MVELYPFLRAFLLNFIFFCIAGNRNCNAHFAFPPSCFSVVFFLLPSVSQGSRCTSHHRHRKLSETEDPIARRRSMPIEMSKFSRFVRLASRPGRRRRQIRLYTLLIKRHYWCHGDQVERVGPQLSMAFRKEQKTGVCLCVCVPYATGCNASMCLYWIRS